LYAILCCGAAQKLEQASRATVWVFRPRVQAALHFRKAAKIPLGEPGLLFKLRPDRLQSLGKGRALLARSDGSRRHLRRLPSALRCAKRLCLGADSRGRAFEHAANVKPDPEVAEITTGSSGETCIPG
jgi:hypothetical protein